VKIVLRKTLPQAPVKKLIWIPLLVLIALATGNMVFEPGIFAGASTQTLVLFTNGTHFTHDQGHLSLAVSTSDYETHVFFNPTNREVRKILQWTMVGTNRFHLIDMDGDGVPDDRKNYSLKTHDVLFRGDWFPTRGLLTNREVLVSNVWIPIRFERGRWRTPMHIE
jgi:hypothetical protein